MTSNATGLAKSLTRFDGTMIVMGTIVGIGIFFQPAKVAASAGSGGLSLVAWVVGSVLALTGAFTYAALGRLVPRTGGPYLYLREAFGPFPAFLYGFTILATIGSGATAVVGLILVDYLARFLRLSLESFDRSLLAAAIVAGLAAVNIVGVKWGSRVQNVLTLLKVAALLGLVVAGLTRGDVPIDFAPIDAATAPATLSTSLAGLAAAMAGVLFAFGGWQNLSNVAGEMKAPEKDLVPAILLGVIGVAILYVLANVAFLRLLPADVLAASPTPAADALERAIGAGAGDLASLLIVVSAIGIVNGLMLSLPRIYYAMARDGLLPRVFAGVSTRFRTPAAAIAIQAFCACSLCFVSSVFALTDYVAFADWLFFSLNAFALFALVRKREARDVGLGYPYVPALFGALATAVTIGMMITLWDNARYGLLVLAVGAVIYRTIPRRGIAANA
jgi:APA family basic amino acid/polyamine antiporter